jgi:lipoprotein-anchoring transpeptidase ErfK/SrfK
MESRNKRNNSLSRYYIPAILVCYLAACTASPTATPAPAATRPPTQTQTASPNPSPTPTVTLTPEAAWYEQIDPSYAVMEYRYGLVENPDARRYVSLEDAVNQTGNFDTLHIIPAYVAIVGEESRDGHTYYQFNYGWMEAANVQLLTSSSLRGILLTREVDFRFGWVLRDIQSVNAAGTPIQAYSRYQIVHEVPAVTENPGYIAVGPDEWLPDEAVALTRSQVPEDVGADTCHFIFIYVDLAEQTLRVYHKCELVFATLVSTGKQAGWTYPGRFSIQTWVPHIQLTAPVGSTSVYYQEAVPNFMSYYGDLGFHGAYWHDDFGTPVSHGCVNLSPADAKWLYDWTEMWMGAAVIISQGE